MRPVSASAVNNFWRRYHPQKNAIQQSLSTHTGRKRDVTVACAQLNLEGHNNLFLQTPFSTEIEVCRYLDALVDCRLPSTWACRQLQLAVEFGDTKRQYERLINWKINSHIPSVWVNWALGYLKNRRDTQFWRSKEKQIQAVKINKYRQYWETNTGSKRETNTGSKEKQIQAVKEKQIQAVKRNKCRQ